MISLTLLILLALPIVYSQPAIRQTPRERCDQLVPESDQDSDPPFICEFSVEFKRQPDCSALIIENFIYPYTLPRNLSRFIIEIPDVQNVTDVSVERDSEVIPSFVSSHSRDEVRVQYPAIRSKQPVRFKLKYTLKNAVWHFTETCSLQDTEVDRSQNIMRWRSGNKFLESFDKFVIQFETENPNAKLRILEQNEQSSSTDDKQIVRLNDVKDTDIRFYTSEEGVDLCPEDFECFPGGTNLAVAIGLSVTAAIVVIVLAIWLGAKCCTRVLTKKHAESAMDPL